MSTVLITGANRGIGLELARAYVQRGDTVIGTARNPEAATDLDALDGVEVVQLDVGDGDSVAALAKALEGRSVDVLLNNAGIMGPPPQNQSAKAMDYQGFAETLEINAIAPVRVMHALMPNLLASDDAKVANITSQLGAISFQHMRMAYAYCASKAALNKFMRMAAEDLKGDGISICLIHPGWVQTDMGGAEADITPAESAAGIVQVIDGLGAESTGSFWKWNGETHDW